MTDFFKVMDCSMNVMRPYGILEENVNKIVNVQEQIECFSGAWEYSKFNIEEAIKGMDKCIQDFETKRTLKWQSILDKMNQKD